MVTGALKSVKMKAFPGRQKYTPINDSSSSNRVRVAPEYELQDQKVPVSSSGQSSNAGEDADEPEGDSLRHDRSKRYSVATSAESSSEPFSPGGRVEKVNTGFSPLFTRRWILLCFAVLWALIIIALQIIYTVSQQQKGLASPDIRLRLIWTYGPTALLVLVTVLWRQVDYAAKYIQPWAALANGPLPGKQTILLDYITDFQVVALWQSVRLRHITITSTIIIFVLIKALTVVSTGLFSLHSTPFSGLSEQMRITTTFDSSAGLPLDKIDSRAAIALYGHTEYNMLLPNGTSEQIAYQLFEPTDNPSGTDTRDAFNASVDVFMADGWDCEAGVLTSETSYNDNSNPDFPRMMSGTASYYNSTIKLPDCEIYNGYLDTPEWLWAGNDTHRVYGYWSAFQRVNCSNIDPSDAKSKRYMISAAYSTANATNSIELLNSSNTVCRPSYKVQPAYVTKFMDGTISNDIVFHGTPRQLDGVTADDIALAVWTSLKQTSIPSGFNDYEFASDTFIENMIRLTPDFKPEMVLNTTWLAEKSRQVYQENSAQVAALYLVGSNDPSTIIQGTVTRVDQRLLVQVIPTRIMQVFAIVMFVLTVTMVFTIPQNVVPRPVESVAAIAVILARSPSLVEILRNTGHLDLQKLRRVLSGHRFMSIMTSTAQGKVFSIRVVTGSATSVSPVTDKKIKWNRPLVLHRVAMILTLCLAVAILITLEVLYRRAQADKGLADVDADSVRRYVWLYAPTVVLVLLATTFNLLDFELEFADPYHELARGYANANSSLLWDPLRNTTVQTCFRALQHARFALVASSISVILAPFLTIVVSGLFVVLQVEDVRSTTAETQTWFNLTDDYNSHFQSGSFALPALILQGNMSYPQWTYDEYAFPSVDLSSKSLKISNATSGSLYVDIPAARASMNCTRLKESDFYDVAYNLDCVDCVAYNISTPNGCGNMGWIGQEYLALVGQTDAPASGTGYFGTFVTSTGVTTSQVTNETIICPSWFTIYGRLENSEIKDYKAFYCDSGLESVQTNATINLQTKSITSVQHVNEFSAQIFNPSWQPEMSGTSSVYFTPINLTHPDESFNDFVTAMVYGKDGVPRDQLLPTPASADTNTSADPFIHQLIHTYRQWTAQWLNLHMRDTISALKANTTNIASGTLPTSLSARYSNPTRQRLFLYEPSLRILQSVIASLVLCGITIFVLVDMSRVLPKKVGSIAAVASLLAGSRLIEEERGLVPVGTEWLSDGEIARRGLWSGEVFRMGWWGHRGDGKGVDGSGSGNGSDSGSLYYGRKSTDDPGEMGEKRGYFGIDVVSKGIE